MENEITKNDIIQWGKEQISEYTGGSMTFELAPTSYDDVISAKTILKAFNEYSENKYNCQNDYEHFKDYLEQSIMENWGYDSLFNAEDAIYDYVYDNATEEMKLAINEYISENNLSISEMLEAFGYQGGNIDIDAFLHNNDYHINLMFATAEEQNYDMSSISNSFPNIDNASYMLSNSSEFENTIDNALTYLINQQGHSLSEVYNVVYSEENSESVFINSVADEINHNYYSGMTELTALVSENGSKLVDILDSIAHKEGYIKLSKDTEIGLFNEWSGAGSLLEINLEMPAVFSAEMVRNVQFESSYNDYVKDNNGYTVNAVYGLVGSVWEQGSIEITDKAPAIIKENSTDLHKAFTENIEKNSPESEKKKANIERD